MGMKRSIFKLAAVLAFVSVSMVVARTEAVVLNVDFNVIDPDLADAGTYVGLGAAPDAPANTTWNGMAHDGSSTSVSAANILASDGSVTPFDVSLVADNPNLNYYESTTTSANIAPALLNDFLYINGANNCRLTISQLNPGTYDLYVYAQNAGHSSQSLTFNVDIGGSQTASTVNSGNPASFIQGNNYMLFTNLTPVAGSISGYWPGAGNGINGFQLVEVVVPEPGLAMLLGAGGLLIWARRRR